MAALRHGLRSSGTGFCTKLYHGWLRMPVSFASWFSGYRKVPLVGSQRSGLSGREIDYDGRLTPADHQGRGREAGEACRSHHVIRALELQIKARHAKSAESRFWRRSLASAISPLSWRRRSVMAIFGHSQLATTARYARHSLPRLMETATVAAGRGRWSMALRRATLTWICGEKLAAIRGEKLALIRCLWHLP